MHCHPLNGPGAVLWEWPNESLVYWKSIQFLKANMIPRKENHIQVARMLTSPWGCSLSKPTYQGLLELEFLSNYGTYSFFFFFFIKSLGWKCTYTHQPAMTMGRGRHKGPNEYPTLVEKKNGSKPEYGRSKSVSNFTYYWSNQRKHRVVSVLEGNLGGRREA